MTKTRILITRRLAMFVISKGCRWLFLVFVVIIALGILSSAMAAPRDEKTVLYMSFDQDPRGGVVDDESGYENHGNIVGQGVKWVEDGRFGSALEFDGASKIDIPHSASLNLSKEITASIWFKTELPQLGRFFIYKIHSGGGRTYEWGIYLTTDSTNVSMYVVKPNDEVGFISKAGDYKDDNWHFLAGTYDGKTVKCFIDGESVSKDWPGEIRTGEDPVVIGTWGSNFFTGTLDEARICNVALTEEQLKSDYENGYSFLAVDSTGKLTTTWAMIKAQ
jgi:hypothetical protein